nr:hypothetical protein [Tanacetum cinerariifolium]
LGRGGKLRVCRELVAGNGERLRGNGYGGGGKWGGDKQYI